MHLSSKTQRENQVQGAAWQYPVVAIALVGTPATTHQHTTCQQCPCKKPEQEGSIRVQLQQDAALMTGPSNTHNTSATLQYTQVWHALLHSRAVGPGGHKSINILLLGQEAHRIQTRGSSPRSMYVAFYRTLPSQHLSGSRFCKYTF